MGFTWGFGRKEKLQLRGEVAQKDRPCRALQYTERWSEAGFGHEGVGTKLRHWGLGFQCLGLNSVLKSRVVGLGIARRARGRCSVQQGDTLKLRATCSRVGLNMNHPKSYY